MPQGVTVGSYNSYLDAQKAVDYLADQQFPVQYVSIVGNDLKLVERVTGRLSYPRVAMSGLLSGVWFGLFIGLLLSLFSPGGAFSVVTSVLMGAAFFALFGIVSYAMQRGKRDFTSTSQVLASSYDVIVAPEVAGEASRLLLQLPMRGNDGGAASTVSSRVRRVASTPATGRVTASLRRRRNRSGPRAGATRTDSAPRTPASRLRLRNSRPRPPCPRTTVIFRTVARSTASA